MQEGGTLSTLPVTTNVSKVEKPKFNRGGNGSMLEITMFYVNGLPFPVTLAFRSGLAITVPPDITNLRYSNDFVVQVRYRYDQSVIIDRHQVLDAVSGDTSIEAQALKEAFSGAKGKGFRGTSEFTLDYVLTRQSFLNAGGAVFIQELDLVVAKEGGTAVVHPESQLGLQLKHKLAGNAAGQFVYSIDINDPNHRYGDQWVNIAGKVYKVPARHDTSECEGVYVRSPFPDGEKKFGHEFLCERLDFEKAGSELALYRTANEARTLGDEAGARKRELEELQQKHRVQQFDHEVKLREMSNQHEKDALQLKLDLIAESRKTKLAEDEAAAHKRDLESSRATIEHMRALQNMEMKDHYEGRSHARKDTSEVVKWLPAIITGIGLLVLKVMAESKS